MTLPKAIIDCDPGHDDAVAILLAARHFDLLGVTTVGGNAPIENVTLNARRVLQLIGRSEVRVAKGAARPLIKELRTAASVHGESGLDGATLPEPTAPIDQRHAVEFLIDTIMATDGVTLFAVGPLTNVATALRMEPRLADRLAGISLMGGSASWGNATATAEFNIWVDAEAADIVFRSGVPLTMCGLNLTRQADVDEAITARMRSLGNRTGETFAQLLDWNRRSAAVIFGGSSVPLHDPCAVAAALEPGMFEFVDAHVAIELRGQHTYGMTVVDRRYGSGESGAELRRRAGAEPANCRVAVKIDRERFFSLIIEAMAAFP